MESAFTSLQSVEHYFICSCCSCNGSCCSTYQLFRLFPAPRHALPHQCSCCSTCQLFLLFHAQFVLFPAPGHAVPRVSCSCCSMEQFVLFHMSVEPTSCKHQGEHEPSAPWLWFWGASPHMCLTPHLVQGRHSSDPSLGSAHAGAISDPCSCPPSTLHSLSPPPPFLSLHFSSEEYCASFRHYPKQSPPQSANCAAVWTVPPFGAHRAWHGAETPQAVEQGADGTNEHKEPPSPSRLTWGMCPVPPWAEPSCSSRSWMSKCHLQKVEDEQHHAGVLGPGLETQLSLLPHCMRNPNTLGPPVLTRKRRTLAGLVWGSHLRRFCAFAVPRASCYRQPRRPL